MRLRLGEEHGLHRRAFEQDAFHDSVAANRVVDEAWGFASEWNSAQTCTLRRRWGLEHQPVGRFCRARAEGRQA